MSLSDEELSWLQDKDHEKKNAFTGDDYLSQAELEKMGIFSAHTVVARNSKIGKHPRIGHLSVVEADVTIGDSLLAGDGGYIGSGASIGNDVFTQTNVVISAGAQIGDNVIIGSHVFIGPGVYIGAGAKIGHFVRILGRYTPIVNDVDDPDDPYFDADLVRTEDDNTTTIGAGVEIQSFVWIGQGIIIGDNSTIGNFVTVHDRSHIKMRTTVDDRAIVDPL